MKSTRWKVRLVGYPMYEIALAPSADLAARRYVTGFAEGTYEAQVQPEEGGKWKRFLVNIELKPSITVRAKP